MKCEILKHLKSSFGEYISGEELSNRLNVSRTAIWKHISLMREEGYIIKSSSRKGYKLISVPDVLYAEEIKSELQTQVIGKNIVYYDAVRSTNTLAAEMAFDNCPEGTVVIAEKQLSGKGRMGRQWYSPSGKGVWMSIVLRPNISPEHAPFITIIAALAVYFSLERKYSIKAGIKWPNDLIVSDKKISGILTEMNAELERVNHIIVGIGVNANFCENDFPSSIEDIATSMKIILGKDIPRKELAIAILSNFETLYFDAFKKEERKRLISLYKDRTITLGNKVKALYKGEIIEGEAIDITDSGELLIKTDDGETKKIFSGEVEHCG